LEKSFQERYGGQWSLQAQFHPTARQTSRTVRDELGLPAERKLAVVFSHVLWDATFWAGTDLYRNYSDWLVNVVRSAIKNPEIHWVIKSHPANAFRHAAGDVTERCAEQRLIRETFQTLPDHITVLPPDTHIGSLALYQEADVGLTVRGSPGFEMACFGKPVLTAGTGAYVGFGFTHDSETVSAFEERLASLHTMGPISAEWRRRAGAYALTLFEYRPWRLRAFNMAFRIGGMRRALDRNIEPAFSSVRDLQAAQDLRRAGRWMLEADAVDYLEMVNDAV
jgi:hypothetical protein